MARVKTSVKEYLKPILGENVPDDITEYIMSIEQEEDYHDFMESVVDVNNKTHIDMYDLLKRELFGGKRDTPPRGKKDVPSQSSQGGQVQASQGKGKKSKYINFYGQDNKPGLRKGRHPCDCQASKHELVNNCLKCGRIVCEQEGSGPCLFCDNMVCTRYEMDILNSNTKDSDRLYNQIMEQKKTKEWKRAIESRNRLIETDQLGVVKNKVFDDQNDYFDSNSGWMNREEQATNRRKYRSAHETVHRSRRDFKLALDFASRTVTTDDDEQKKQKQNLLKGVNKLLDNTEGRFPKNLFEGDKGQLITEIVKLMEDNKISNSSKNTVKQVGNMDKKSCVSNKFRIANSDFLESVDQGMCLSMHQPWASLLVAGIKIHEGRTWKTEHRGRLWIAAASKEPEDDEILSCEEMYRALYNDPTIEFPKKYPTSCLLGCVIVEDCLEQKEYKQRYPDGESESPYVLICSGPVILPVFYPMQGQHKIFQLPQELHKSAKAALMSSKWV